MVTKNRKQGFLGSTLTSTTTEAVTAIVPRRFIVFMAGRVWTNAGNIPSLLFSSHSIALKNLVFTLYTVNFSASRDMKVI